MLQVWGSADFVFNIGYVCYGCGDWQILCLISAMRVLQVWGTADFVFNIGYVCYRCGDRQILCLISVMCVTGVGIGRFCV